MKYVLRPRQKLVELYGKKWRELCSKNNSIDHIGLFLLIRKIKFHLSFH